MNTSMRLHLLQLSIIETQRNMMTEMSMAAVALDATVATLQASTTTQTARIAAQTASIATLQASATAQTATIATLQSTSGGFCQSFTISTDVQLARLAPFTRMCGLIWGDLTIQGAGVTNGRLLAEAFQGLHSVTGMFTISGTGLTTLAGSFSALRTVGETLLINFNPLTTLAGSFNALTTVGGDLYVHHNAMTTIGASFGSLQSVVHLMFSMNGGQTTVASTAGSRSFCASVRAVWCPAANYHTNSGAADGSGSCC